MNYWNFTHAVSRLSEKQRLGIVVSRFNNTIGERLISGVRERLQEHGVPEAFIVQASVPGAIEIPVLLDHWARIGAYAGFIALGAVIRGETTHYDLVCQQVSAGCQQVSLTYHIPVTFGVLTTENTEQALARSGGEHSHKGREAADAALAMIDLFGTQQG